jgi:hypothetical protein
VACLKVLAAAVSLGLATPAVAQQTPAAPTTRIDDVVVTGPVSPTGLHDFTRSAVATPHGRRVARWYREICVEVRNIGPEHTAYLHERIAALAGEVGLGMAGPNCSSPVLVIGSEDGAALARVMVERDPRAFIPDVLNTGLGREALARFTRSDAPVRWWHVSLPVDADTGEPVSRRMNSVTRGSRLRSDTRDDLKSVVIIIDVPRAGPAPFDALSDYVAMVALMPAEPEPDLAPYPTIMNLFHEGRVQPGVTGLTALDRDYLQALYAASRDHSVASQQHSEIVHRMEASREAREEGRSDASGQ